MIGRNGTLVGVVLAFALVLVACGSDAGPASTTPTAASAPPAEPVADFPIEVFAALSEDPVTEELAAEFQAALATHDVSDEGGMSATVATRVPAGRRS